MKTISTTAAPAAIGPYSQAKISGGLVFASGQIPVDPSTGAIEAKDIAGQTEQICKNIAALLNAAGHAAHPHLNARFQAQPQEHMRL